MSQTPKQRVIIVYQSNTQQQNLIIGHDDSEQFVELIQLPNAKTAQKQQFAHVQNTLYEIQQTRHKRCASWFIDETVQKDGSLFVLTPVDPLFLALPILDKARFEHATKESKESGIFCTAFQIFEQNNLLHKFVQHEQLELLCDVKGLHMFFSHVPIDLGDMVYRFSDTKAMSWLQKKHAQIVAGLAQNSNYVEKQIVQPKASKFRASLKQASPQKGTNHYCITME